MPVSQCAVKNVNYLFRLACENLQPNDLGLFDEITTVKQYMGPDPSLDEHLEEIIRSYVRDSIRIGMPRSRPQILHEIEIYLNTYGIHVPRFRNGKPGKYEIHPFTCVQLFLLVLLI